MGPLPGHPGHPGSPGIRDWRTVPRITATEVRARTAAGLDLVLVDVRRPTARRSGYIVGDISHPRRSHREDPPLPRDRTLILY